MVYYFGAARRSSICRVTSRAHSMKRSTTGLNVRFFNVMIPTGVVRSGRSTGSTLMA
jgi:hypothetical protein